MEEEEQPRATLEGAKSTASGFSSSLSHETVCQREESQKTLGSDSFCNRMCSLISKPDVEKLTEIQLETHSKFKKMNGNFSHFNYYSYDRYEKLHVHFQNHTRMITEMKKDLDIVFRRIRNLKTKLSKQYGNAFAVTSPNIQKLEKDKEAGHEDYKEEKPQNLQQERTSDDVRISGPVQPQESSSSLTSEGSIGTPPNNHQNEKVEKRFPQENQVKVPVLRPQLSSSDDNYDDSESDKDEGAQQYDANFGNEAEESNLHNGACRDSYPAKHELTDLKLTTQEKGHQLIHRSTLPLAISSSDESLEEDTGDDENEDESETSEEKIPTIKNEINIQIPK